MQLYARVSGVIFGILMLVLSVTVAVETVIRKLFSISLGGVDELSGYAIAVGAPLAFTVALVERSHIRINIVHQRLGTRAQAILNALAAVTLGLLAAYLLIFTISTVDDTAAYHSIAQTPWATPLIYPQALWALAMAVFAVAAVWLAMRAVRLMAAARWDELNREFHPATVIEELESELESLNKR